MSLEAAIQANTTAIQQLSDLIAFQISSTAANDQSLAHELNDKIEQAAAEPKAAPAADANQKAAPEPKAAGPKAAEPKAAEPKAAEPKAAEPKAAEPKAAEKEWKYQEVAEIVTAYAKVHGTPATRVKLNELAGVETLTKAKPESYAAIAAGLQE